MITLSEQDHRLRADLAQGTATEGQLDTFLSALRRELLDALAWVPASCHEADGGGRRADCQCQAFMREQAADIIRSLLGGQGARA